MPTGSLTGIERRCDTLLRRHRWRDCRDRQSIRWFASIANSRQPRSTRASLAPSDGTLLVGAGTRCLSLLLKPEVVLHHHPHKIIEPHRGFPTQSRTSLGRIPHQLIDVTGTKKSVIDPDEVLPIRDS